jgi:hypothetical protein
MDEGRIDRIAREMTAKAKLHYVVHSRDKVTILWRYYFHGNIDEVEARMLFNKADDALGEIEDLMDRSPVEPLRDVSWTGEPPFIQAKDGFIQAQARLRGVADVEAFTTWLVKSEGVREWKARL